MRGNVLTMSAECANSGDQVLKYCNMVSNKCNSPPTKGVLILIKTASARVIKSEHKGCLDSEILARYVGVR